MEMNTNRANRTKATRMALPAAALPGQTATPNPTTDSNAKAAAPMATGQITEIAARINVGWGNALFIRGQGDGLSWDKGTPLVCADGSTWVWSTRQAKASIVFKLLLNDQLWAAGPDRVVEPGKRLEVIPAF